MKKTFTINISGTIFHIEEDAYERLQGYFMKLKSHFGNEAEGREIIADIEGRVAELFLEKNRGENRVITLDLIEEIISIMGTPEDFIEQEADTEYVPGTTRRKKRLYRSPESRVIAGVCGGLGAYFRIDPVFIRILFVLLLFVNGIGIIAYLILWIAVPKARTTSQILEMRGEEVTVSNIERKFRDQAQEDEGKPKVDDGTGNAGSETQNVSASYGGEGFSRKRGSDVSADIGKAFLRVIAVVFGAFFIIAGFFGLIALVSSLIVGQSLVESWPAMWSPDLQISGFLGHFISPGALTAGIVSLAVIIGIPLLAILFVGTKLVFNYRSNNTAIGLGMTGVWLIALLILIFVSAGQAANFKNQTSLTSTETIYCEPCPTLYLQLADDRYGKYPEADWDLDRFKIVSVDGEKVMLGQPSFDIEKSNTGDIVLLFRKRARGKDQDDANNNIQEMIFNYQVKDSLIIFDPWFLTGTESKWRDQKMEITLKLPVGRSVYLSDEMARIIFDIENVSGTWDHDMAGKYWEMRPEGLTLKENSGS
jgi:phage shock protein PspC (stress-responsive transcriptional regulator)